jgi:malonate-semialdehyde dehydrogenase (acetylating)/methylmalonate-semialdehyde dehydrogenase
MMETTRHTVGDQKIATNTYTHFINGHKTPAAGRRTLKVYNPATGRVTNEVKPATEDEIEAAVTAASEAYPAWSGTPALKRARVLFTFKALMETKVDELATLLTAEHGKVLADARGEVRRGIELVEIMCGIPALLKGQYSQNVGTNIDCYTIRQPLGVCIGVTPFNFPIMISCWQMISAIACGNTFILKPSEKDPGAPLRLLELLTEAGLPAGVANLLQGDKTTVEYLLQHKTIKAVSCVGSTPVAQSIYITAINNGKRAQTFGGAKNHAVLMPDADMPAAIEAIMGAAFGAAGERCMALPVVVAIGDEVADLLVSSLQQRLPNLKVGAGTAADVEMGPLISQEHRQRVLAYVEQGIKEGATLAYDGRELTVDAYESGFFMGPCLFDHVTEAMTIYKEEIFGPVLSVVRVKDFATALSLVNEHEYGNGTAIFTQDGATAREFASKVQAGMVGINIPIPVPVSYHSFGGWKKSVFGDIAMHGEESVRFYTQPKSITQTWFKSKLDSAVIMPTHD